jgi:hypothetical protein
VQRRKRERGGRGGGWGGKRKGVPPGAMMAYEAYISN